MSTNQSRSQASGGFILLQVFVICVVLFTTLAIVMQYVVGLSASVRDRTDLSTAQTAAAAGQDGLVYSMKKYPNFRPDNPNYFSKKAMTAIYIPITVMAVILIKKSVALEIKMLTALSATSEPKPYFRLWPR